MADTGGVESGVFFDELKTALQTLKASQMKVQDLLKNASIPSYPFDEEPFPAPPTREAFYRNFADLPIPKSETNNDLNWDNLNEREQFILMFISNNGKFSTDNFEIINQAWSEKLGKVTQSRFSQIISTLIKENWLEKIGSKGTGSSRMIIVSPNAKSNIGSLDIENIRKKPPKSYRRWNSEQDRKLESLHKSGKSFAHIARKMGRTQSSIRSRIFVLG